MSKLIKTAPESIYLVVCDEDGCTSSFDEHHEVTWCADKQNTSDIKYIRADLVESMITPKSSAEKGKCKRCGMMGRDASGDTPSCTYCGIKNPDSDS